MSTRRPAIPFKAAIIGSGPSGFYAAEALLDSGIDVEISMIERLPAPFGLVRYGVAPDHPKLKQPIAVFDKIALSPRFHFFGNVKLCEDVTIESLLSLYDAIIVACGANADCALGIPGEQLAGCHTAMEFVGWYNGHPDYSDRHFDLSQESVAIIGNGNVALDVARILAKTPDELRHTDIADCAMTSLAASRVKEIHIIGRRGPAQAKFSPQELQEFGRLTYCRPIVKPDDLVLNAASRIETTDKMSRSLARNIEILKDFGHAPTGPTLRTCTFHFLQSPLEVLGSNRVSGLRLRQNRLQGEAFQQIALETGALSDIDCGLIFRSVGYRGTPIEGLPFDRRRGVIPTRNGRVMDEKGEPRRGLYAVGWISRGPSGTIGTNRADSMDAMAELVNDLLALPSATKAGADGLRAELHARQKLFIDYPAWQRIDRSEIENGHARDKAREKFTRVCEMLSAAGRLD